jgi:hypothetical protein
VIVRVDTRVPQDQVLLEIIADRDDRANLHAGDDVESAPADFHRIDDVARFDSEAGEAGSRQMGAAEKDA